MSMGKSSRQFRFVSRRATFDFQQDRINGRLTAWEGPGTIQIVIIACWGKLYVVAQDQPKDFPPLPAEAVCLNLLLLQPPDIR